MSARSTLAEQLAQISQPAPQDFDPEDSYATYANEKSSAQVDLDAARQDYVQVGPSGLRRKNQAVVDPKYSGAVKSRKALYGDEDDDEEDDTDSNSEQGVKGFADSAGSDDEVEVEDEQDEEDKFGDFQDLEADDSRQDESEGSEEESQSEDDERQELQQRNGLATTRPASKEQGEKAMIKQLRQAASADVEKGRDVKKQLAFCDNVLESRIKLQKAATAVNSLPQHDNASKYFSQLSDEISDTLAAIEQVNEQLFKLRQSIAQTNDQVQLPADFGATRKRKRGGDSPDQYLDATLADLAAFDAACEPFLRSTVTKWSDKVLAASGLALSSSKKFKAVNQNVMSQIDHALSNTERERLIKRTRVRRSTDKPIVGKPELAELDGEKKMGDEQVFDDGDFYQQLLRDVIESRMLDLDDPTLESLRMASARQRKQKKVVDTRASKGRKIRYHVHEKAQNFMIPIEAGAWHDEQIDELFASLLGRNFKNGGASKDKEDDDETLGGTLAQSQVDVGSLRLFG
ncbi:rRNA-processing protein bfr2 [Microbotryomycetes sp. JL201]|nr:rRNA-processing protein bfr2 [Microbotryomycetes sp. JL201]